jgi:hypothetical protein
MYKAYLSSTVAERQYITNTQVVARGNFLGAAKLDGSYYDAPLYTRLSNGFSRKIENHAAATALNYFAYNFIKIHRTLRTSPAMAAGVTDRLERGRFGSPLGIIRAAEGGKSGSIGEMMWPFLIWDALVLLVAIGGLVGGIYIFRMLRKPK